MESCILLGAGADSPQRNRGSRVVLPTLLSHSLALQAPIPPPSLAAAASAIVLWVVLVASEAWSVACTVIAYSVVAVASYEVHSSLAARSQSLVSYAYYRASAASDDMAYTAADTGIEAVDSIAVAEGTVGNTAVVLAGSMLRRTEFDVWEIVAQDRDMSGNLVDVVSSMVWKEVYVGGLSQPACYGSCRRQEGIRVSSKCSSDRHYFCLIALASLMLRAGRVFLGRLH